MVVTNVLILNGHANKFITQKGKMKPETFSYQQSDSIAEEKSNEVNEESGFPYSSNTQGILSHDDIRFRSLIRSNVCRKKASPEILSAIRTSIQSS